MARPKPWIPRILEITALVEVSTSKFFVRRDIEQMFQIRASAAKDLMDVAGAKETADGLRLTRGALLDYLKFSTDARVALQEIDRREKLHRASEKMREEAKLRKFPITDYEGRLADEWILFAEMPNVSLKKGELHITFTSVEDLTRQLWQFSRAIANEHDEFVRRCEGEPPTHTEKELRAGC